MSIHENPQFWDRAAQKYAASAIADLPGYEHTIERTHSLLRADDRVLELGCGTGSTALRLAGAVTSYLATDISAGMIAIAEEKRAVNPILGLGFLCATAGMLAADEVQHDAVLGFNYLHLVGNLDATLSHIHALTVPGGLFISKTPCLAEMNPLIRVAVPAMRAIGKAPHVNFFDTARLQSAIRAAGFDILATERHATKGKDTRPFILARRR